MEYTEISGPIWPERCGHGGYVGSFKAIYLLGNKELKEELCDLYVWENKDSVFKVECCIRFGDNDAEYYSPGSVVNLVECREFEPYRSAYYMLKDKGYFSWKKKNK